MFQGDIVPPQFYGPQILFAPMATAIARIYTRQGFVVAADGRKRSQHNGNFQVMSDTQQKLFPFENSNMSIAFSMAGAVAITPEDQDDLIVFSLVDEVAKAQSALAERKCDTLLQYSQVFADLMYERLSAVQQIPNVRLPERKLDPTLSDFVIFHIFFDGYFLGEPQRSFVRFTHENQKLKQPFVSAEDLYMGHVLGYGSAVMHNLVFHTEDQRFAKYRLPHRSPEEIELRDAVEMVSNFINACSSEEAMAVDVDHCAGIGGHVCIATVTPSKGFRWVKDHKPIVGN